MKKIKMATAVLLLLCAFVAKAQVRHIKGIQGIELGGGASRFGFIAYGSHVVYFNKKFYLKSLLFYEKAKLANGNVSVSDVGLEVLPAYNLYNMPGKFYFNLIGGISAIVKENMKGSTNAIEGASKIEAFKFGFMGGGEVEYYVSEKISLISTFGQRYYFSPYGSWRWGLTCGVRYSLLR